MIDTFALVREFHETFELPIGEREHIPEDPKQVLMRVHLIGEEASELARGGADASPLAIFDALCDLQYVIDGTYVVMGFGKPAERQALPNTPSAPLADGPAAVQSMHFMAQIYRELAAFSLQCATQNLMRALFHLNEMQFCLWSAYQLLGYEKAREAGFREVHRSNMSKLGEDGRPMKSAGGRILKGPNYSPPDLGAVLIQTFGKGQS